MWRKLMEWLAAWLNGGDTVEPPVPVPTPTPAPSNDAALTPKPSRLCEPAKGVECPVPWGLDVRFLAWSPSKGDWVFVGCSDAIAATTRNGKTITGGDWQRDGVRYVYAGYRVPTSASPLVAERTGQYRETYRLYYWATREGAT